jgi:hypothetical protein
VATGPDFVQPKQASTLYLRVPADDWASVKQGYKSEFRMKTGKGIQFLRILLPTPVVAYMTTRSGLKAGRHDKVMMVVTDSWTEPLGAISADSLEREGFPDMAHFRRYWTGRTNQRFMPLMSIQVFRVRRYTPEDREALGAILLDRLYGEYTGANTERSLVSQRGPVSESLR